jgi:signal transduction histidine kinase
MLELAVAEAEIPATVSVALDVESDLPPVFVDARQIVAVLRNLFVNAAQALSRSGTLSVTARRKGKVVTVDVADTGCGIKPEHLDRIFEPLFTTKNIGVGLGLAICKGFIETNKGTISVVSEVGKGTTFTVLLPVAKDKASAGSNIEAGKPLLPEP